MSSFEWMELQTLSSDIEIARTRLVEARKRRDHGRIRALEVEITRAEASRLRLVGDLSTSIAGAAELPPQPNGKAGAEPAEILAPVAQAPPSKVAAEQPPAGEFTAVAEPAAPAEANDAAASSDVLVAAALLSALTGDPAAEAKPARGRRAKESAASDEAPATDANTPADQPEAEPPPVEPRIQVGAAAASPASGRMALSLQGDTNVWDKLTPRDIASAKIELGVRRAEILARQAAELQTLDADQTQLETLVQAIDAFVQKFTLSSPDGIVVRLEEEREQRLGAG